MVCVQLTHSLRVLEENPVVEIHCQAEGGHTDRAPSDMLTEGLLVESREGAFT